MERLRTKFEEMKMSKLALQKEYETLSATFVTTDSRLQCEMDYTIKVNQANARLGKVDSS